MAFNFNSHPSLRGLPTMYPPATPLHQLTLALLRARTETEAAELCRLLLNHPDAQASIGTLQFSLHDDLPLVRMASARLLGEQKLTHSSSIDGLVDLASTDSDIKVQLTAIDSLGRLKNPLATLPLCLLLGTSNEGVRLAATAALEAIGDPAAYEFLALRLLDDFSPAVRLACLKSISAIMGDVPWITLAHSAREDKVLGIRTEALNQLHSLGYPFMAELGITVLENDQDGEVRQAAAEILGVREELKAVESLIWHLEHDPSYRSTSCSRAKPRENRRCKGGVPSDEGHENTP